VVVIRQSVLDEIHSHGRHTPDVEVCGVLVGDCTPQGLTRAEAAIRGENAVATAGSVTFTADTWTYIQDTMDRCYPEKRIIGWYHTHPDFGIFLSGMDEFIHTSFFDLPWQIAFVYDPVRREEGMFAWSDGKPVLTAFEVEDDTARRKRALRILALRKARRLQRRLTVLLVSLLCLLLGTAAWLVTVTKLAPS
jgi:proteasome lid subunit RPN8/RPN11